MRRGGCDKALQDMYLLVKGITVHCFIVTREVPYSLNILSHGEGERSVSLARWGLYLCT